MELAALRNNAETKFLAMVSGALSFAHIHDLSLTHHQVGWRSWTYPISIDAVTVHALRLILRPGLRKGALALAWAEFTLFTAASLAANLLDAPVHDPIGMGLSVLPSAAFVFSTLLGHLLAHRPDEQAGPTEESTPPLAAAAPTRPAPPRAPRKRAASQPRAATSRAAIARGLASDFRRTYQGAESDRGRTFNELVNTHLVARGLKPLDDRAIRRALQDA